MKFACNDINFSSEDFESADNDLPENAVVSLDSTYFNLIKDDEDELRDAIEDEIERSTGYIPTDFTWALIPIDFT